MDNTIFNDYLWNLLKKHYGHKVSIAIWGEENNPANISLVDEDTQEIIIDAEIYTLCGRDDI